MCEELGELAFACRVLAAEGHEDFTMGHLSMRDGRDGFWLKRADIGLGEVRGPQDFIRVSFDGEVLEGSGGLHREWPLHAEILRRRQDLRVVGHSHPPWATRFSAVTEPLRAVGNYGVMFAAGVPRFELTSDLIDTPQLGAQLALALGEARAVFLRNHGIAFGGESVGAAALTAIYLERAAADHLTLVAAGVEFETPSSEELSAKGATTVRPAALDRFWQFLRRQQENR